jgi:site-specific recombinase XerD
VADGLSFAHFLSHIRGRSERTIDAYVRDVSAFEQFCAACQWEPAESLTTPRVGQYLMARTEKSRRGPDDAAELGSRSAARHVSALTAYGGYLVFMGRLEQSALVQLRAPKYSAKLPAYFNVEEIRALVCAYDGGDSPRELRSAAILHLIYSAGLRVGECAGLTLPAIDHDRRTLTVLGKGSREREVPFGSHAHERLLAYLEGGRPQLSGPGSGSWVWLGPRGGRLTVRTMQRVLDDAASRAGCIKPVSPHKLRHACATHMLEGGADVRLLQELLGHQSLNTTQVYTQITRTRLLDVYDKTHPRAGRSSS